MVRKIWPKQFQPVRLQNESQTSYLSESGEKETACNILSISGFNHLGYLANKGLRACALLRVFCLYELKIKCVVQHKYCMAVGLFPVVIRIDRDLDSFPTLFLSLVQNCHKTFTSSAQFSMAGRKVAHILYNLSSWGIVSIRTDMFPCLKA